MTFWSACIILFSPLFVHCSPFIDPKNYQRVRSINPNHNVKYAHSATDIINLAKTEENLIQILTDYQQTIEERLVLIKRYLADYEGSSKAGTKHLNPSDDNSKERAAVISSHPLLSFRMMRRFASEFVEIKVKAENSEAEFKASVATLKGNVTWPKAEDVVSLAESLHLIQFNYDLDIMEFTSGNIQGMQTKVGLTSQQCLEIGEYISNSKTYAPGIQWIAAAIEKMVNEKKIGIFVENELYYYEALQKAILKHNEAWVDPNSSDHYLYLTTIKLNETDDLSTDQMYFNHFLNRYKGKKYFMGLDYFALCAGETFQTAAVQSKLYCWYELKSHPFWYINPLKMEVLNLDPYLLQIYEVIGDKMIHILKELSNSKMQRAETSNTIKKPSAFLPNILPPSKEILNIQMPTQGRTSMVSWLSDENVTEIMSIPRIIEFITGLQVIHSSQLLQVSSYATGGHFTVHSDTSYIFPEIFNDLRRMATFMIYLNDVELGGHTAFVDIGISVKPTKGSALFWYNLRKNGTVDFNVNHGGCPVAYGSKWIANKWIISDKNLFSRKCSLDPTE